MHHLKHKAQRSNQENQLGFGLFSVLMLIVVLVLVVASGVYAWHRDHKAKGNATSHTTTMASTAGSGSKSGGSGSTAASADPYAGWKTYCDSTISSCFKYPPDWNAVSGFPGAFEDSDDKAYTSLSGGTTKDRAQDTVYVQSAEGITTSATPLTILGYIDNNEPGYGVYDSSYLASIGIKAGMTAQLVDGNYAFNGKVGDVSLVATPGENGYAAITTFVQAQNWFSTPAAQTCLKALRSFYYE